MRPDDIRAHLHKHLFAPIRVFVSDGSFYDVVHHDFMLVSRTEVIIGLSASPEEIPEKKAYLDPVHITRIEPINRKRAKSDGKKGTRWVDQTVDFGEFIGRLEDHLAPKLHTGE